MTAITDLTGHNLIGDTESADRAETFTAYSTAEARALETRFHPATAAEVDRAATLAADAAPDFRAISPNRRAAFLDAIAAELLAAGDELLAVAHAETALPLPRLTGERMRTVNQLRMFATLIRDGSWVDARIDTALPDRAPLPRPDLRRMLIPLGPVAVFGASNFPFAYSVAGGDTASALAAGCPVVVKAHPAHPGTSEMTARAVLAAAKSTGMPTGVFSMLHGHAETGVALVTHPAITAVGFTGSLAGGRALCDAAAARRAPIPVYAEMGSVNPVFVLPGALRDRSGERGAAIATGLAQSVTLGVGQFCTNPGLAVGVAGTEWDAFAHAVAEAAAKVAPAVMLTAGICDAFGRGHERMAATDGVQRLSTGETIAATPHASAPAVFATDAQTFLRETHLAHEVFGPSTLLIACQNADEVMAVAQNLEGQLTVTVHATDADLHEYPALVGALETKAGRIIFNGFPTGVEVSSAMQHGGPYPASSDSRTTSVGTAAIVRWVRPVCWQDAPEAVLPAELRNENPQGIWRTVDGAWTKETR